MKPISKVIMLSDERNGIAAPKKAMGCIDWSDINIVNLKETLTKDILIVSTFNINCDGADSESYWESWQYICENAVLEYKPTGQRFTVYQDGDVWLIDQTAVVGIDHELWESDD